MKSIFKMAVVAVVAVMAVAIDASAQQVAGVRSGLAVGANKVTITEQSDVAQTVRAIEQRKGRTKVSGYTILILSDNSETARENANKAKEAFEENVPETKEAIIELWRFRSVFPKAITQSREMDIEEFIIRPEEEKETEETKN